MEDDDEINPFSHLLTDEDNKPNAFSIVQNDSPNHELLQKHFLRSIQSTVTIRLLPSEGLSFQLWPAATSLVSLLDSHRINSPNSPLSTVFTTGNANAPLRILELGSGTGIVGIVAAATLGSNVTLTDLPHVVPNLKFNAEANAGVVGSSGGNVTFAPLRWGHADDVEVIGREFDVIVASDVVYHDHLYEPLIETLRLLLIGKKIVFLMAHTKRWKKESVFFNKARKHFFIDVLHVDTPCNGSRVGVVVYRFVHFYSKKDTVTNSGKGMVVLQELFRRLANHLYAMVVCLVVVMLLVAIAHRVGFGDDIQKSNSNYHDRTIRRLRAFHGPSLRLRSHHNTSS